MEGKCPDCNTILEFTLVDYFVFQTGGKRVCNGKNCDNAFNSIRQLKPI